MRRLAAVVLLLFTGRLADSQPYNIATFAGGGMPVNIPATTAGLLGPYAIAADQAGNVFLVNGNTVLRWGAASGVMTLVAGNGTTGPGGDNGPAAIAQIVNPQGLVVGAAGNLYISDAGNYRIREVSNGTIATVAGTGTGGYPVDNSPATATQLACPAGLALDSSGNLYVADPVSSLVYKISDGVITIFAGNGTVGHGATGDNGPATAARLINPTYLALDSDGDLYISDYGTQSVRKVSSGIITTVAGTGTQGFSGDNGPATSAELSNPAGIAVDSTGPLYIADTSNARIRAVSKGVITTVVGTGKLGFSGDNGPAISAQLNSPGAIALDAAGDLFIADAINYRIRKVTNGVITTIVGNSLQGFSGVGGPATVAQIDSPAGVALDSSGGVYFSGEPEAVFEVAEGVLNAFAGTGVEGFSGDNGPAIGAQFASVNGIAVDSVGNLYISDGNRIREISNGIVRTIAGTSAPSPGNDNVPALSANIFPTALAVDAAGDIFFVDAAIVALRKISNGVVTTVASADTLGIGFAAGSTTYTDMPGSIAVDSAGSVFFPDGIHNLIKKVSNGAVTTVAGGGCGCSGNGDNGLAADATLDGPAGVAVDAAGSLYIAERDDGRVRKVSGGVIATIAGNGTNGFSGDGGPATAAELYVPLAMAVDPAGNVYVADSYNNRIRVLIPKGSPCVYSLSSASFQVPAAGGSLTVAIQTADSCAWGVSNFPAWITASSATLGRGAASVSMVVAANPGAARSWSVSTAGVDVQVTQADSSIPSVYSGGVVNAASSAAASPVAPGSIASVYGYFPSISPLTAPGFPLPSQLGGLSMSFGSGIAAPLFAVSTGQVNFQVPWELANQSAALLSVTANGQSSPAQVVNISPFAPGIFAMNGQGTGQGAVLDTSYRLVDAENPAAAGSAAIQIYCTGLGSVTNQPAAGSPGLGDPLSWTVNTPAVTIGGAAATVVFSGLAPGSVGEYQVNALVPAGSSKGDAIPVTIQIAGLTSNTVTIAVR